MSNDRPVSTDALETLGTIIDERAGRDAIHIAVEPVVAGHELFPGQTIALRRGKAYHVERSEAVGIVDPYLKDYVKQGERFWMLLMPRTITSLRHVWSHPAFDDANPKPVSKADAENWMRVYLDEHNDNPGYEALLRAVRNNGRANIMDDDGADDGTVQINPEYVFVGGVDAHGDIDPKFWDMMEVLLGHPIVDRPTHF